MCVQRSVGRYEYVGVIHDIGEYMVIGLIVVWGWINVVLSFRTHPQLSSLFISWLRVFIVLMMTIAMILFAALPVFLLSVIFLGIIFLARDSIGLYIQSTLYAIARLSVCPVVRPSVCHTGGSVKNG